MSKYIDADKLKAEIERLKDKYPSWQLKLAMDDLCDFITSLHQEQPEVQNGKFAFPKYLYARTKDNKTIDMSYAPQDMTAVEYIRNDFVEQEQPDVDLEKELKNERAKLLDAFGSMNGEQCLAIRNFASHFYELGPNTRKK